MAGAGGVTVPAGLRRAPPTLGKTEAVRRLAEQAGLEPGADVAGLLRRLPVLANADWAIRPGAGMPGLVSREVMPAGARSVAPPLFTNGRPAWFPEQSVSEHSPALDVLDVPGGTLALIARAPVVVAGARTIVGDFSSAYAGLVHGLDIDMDRLVAGAVPVAGTALVLCSDIHPLNFCHWLVDELPRIVAVGGRRDVTLIVSEEDAAFRRESLRLCGFPAERVVGVADFSAVRADRLLVTRDLAEMPHPGFKAAPWLLDFLRARVGFAALARYGGAPTPRRIFVSRDDAVGRRVVNESTLMAALAPAGFSRVTLAGRGLAEQVALFSRATLIVGAHGAGLANVVFAPAGARLLEMFPASYGMPSYAVLAAGQGVDYASYVATDVVRGERPQTDDFRIDVEDFWRCCGGFLE